MKVIRTDNYDRDYVDDALVAEGLSVEEASKMADDLNAKEHEDSQDFYRMVADCYELQRWEP